MVLIGVIGGGSYCVSRRWTCRLTRETRAQRVGTTRSFAIRAFNDLQSVVVAFVVGNRGDLPHQLDSSETDCGGSRNRAPEDT
jgi:hypothetical protein